MPLSYKLLPAVTPVMLVLLMGSTAHGEAIAGSPDSGSSGRTASRFMNKTLDLTVLKLTAEQRTTISECRNRNAAKARKIRQSLKASKDDLRNTMFDPGATENQIRAKRREVGRLQDKLDAIQVEDFLSIRSILSPEQRQKLPDMAPGLHHRASSGDAKSNPEGLRTN